MVCALATNSAATKDVNKSSDPILTQLQTLKLNVTSSAATFFFFFFPLQGLESAPHMHHHPNSLQQDATTKVMIHKLQT